MRQGIDRTVLDRQRARTTLLTASLLAALGGTAALVGHLMFGGVGLYAGFFGVVLLVALGTRIPPELVMRLHGAVPLHASTAPGLHRMVAQLADRAGVPRPGVWLLPTREPNALSTGDGDAPGAVAVTRGLLELMEPAELEGVLAHEVAHLRHRDTRVLRLAGVVSRTVVSVLRVGIWVAFFATVLFGAAWNSALLLALLGLVVPPGIAVLQAALARTREYAADDAAAELTGRPMALGAALVKLSRRRHSLLNLLLRPAVVPPLLRSHPSTRERVERLKSMALQPAFARAFGGEDPFVRAAAERPPTWGAEPMLRRPEPASPEAVMRVCSVAARRGGGPPGARAGRRSASSTATALDRAGWSDEGGGAVVMARWRFPGAGRAGVTP